MKAVYYEGNGASRLETPRRVTAAGEVRLDVAYCGICGTDLHIAHGAMDHRVTPPQVIGHEMSGTVAEVGAGVEGSRPAIPSSCGRSTRAPRRPPTRDTATSAAA